MSNKPKSKNPAKAFNDDTPDAIQFTSRDEDVEPDMVELFRIDDTSYYVERKPRVNVTLRYLKMARDEGQELAIAFLLESMLGEEGYEALCNYDDLTQEDFKSVVKVAQKLAMGGLDAPKGK